MFMNQDISMLLQEKGMKKEDFYQVYIFFSKIIKQQKKLLT